MTREALPGDRAYSEAFQTQGFAEATRPDQAQIREACLHSIQQCAGRHDLRPQPCDPFRPDMPMLRLRDAKALLHKLVCCYFACGPLVMDGDSRSKITAGNTRIMRLLPDGSLPSNDAWRCEPLHPNCIGWPSPNGASC